MKRHAPAAERNREPIAAVLTEELPTGGLVLEVASGTGEHIVHFARTYPGLQWQPSDADAQARHSIAAWREEAGLPNLLPPIALDAAAPDWLVARADAILCINMDSNSCDPVTSNTYVACLCINMVHISAWAATVGLFRGCAKLLTADAPLILYGPYFEDAVETAPSNLAFDRSLKERNPEWGLRNVTDVDELAREWGFHRTRRVKLPANNLVLVYRRTR